MCFSFKLWCFLCTPIEFTHFPNRLHSFHCVSTDNHWRPTPARLWADGDPCCGWKQGMFFTLRIFYNFPMNKHITIEYRLPQNTLVERWLGDYYFFARWAGLFYIIFSMLGCHECWTKGSHPLKNNTVLWKKFIKWWPPPRPVFVNSLFRFLTVNFATKSKCDKTA